MIHKVFSLRFTKEDHVRFHKFDKIINFSAFVQSLTWGSTHDEVKVYVHRPFSHGNL